MNLNPSETDPGKIETPAEKHLQGFLALAGKIHHIRCQGKHLKWTVKSPSYKKPPTKKKGAQTTFSPASRLRLISLMCQIIYEKIRPGLFITLTYPPGSRPRGKHDTNEDRRRFWEYWENDLGRETMGMWRMEWEDRKSGSEIGVVYPHFHLLVFAEEFWHHKRVNLLWRWATGEEGYVRTEVKRMASEKQCGWYVAKYIGKLSSSLVINLNLGRAWSGRQWGCHRRQSFPMYPVLDTLLPSSTFLDSLYCYGLEGRELLTDWGSQSYQVLGGRAETMEKLLRDYLLDNEGCSD